MAFIRITDALLKELRFIDRGELRAGETYRMPDFLLVGPQRTGTTWMAENLGLHPNIYMPPEKELYFFGDLRTEHVDSSYRGGSLKGYARHFAPSRFRLWRKRRAARQRFGVERFVTTYGEASATYAATDEAHVREILLLCPDVRIVINVRNPIERAWSHARLEFQWGRRRRLEDVGFAEFREFYASAYMHRCADYAGLLETWARYVRPGHLMVNDFRNLAEHPQALMARLIGFLRVWYDPRFFAAEHLGRAVGSFSARDVPPEHAEFLRGLLAPDLERLQRFCGISFDSPVPSPAYRELALPPQPAFWLPGDGAEATP